MAVRVPTDAIRVERLAKSYGRRRVLDGLSFRVGRGEVFALLGPNGAGKTTTVEILEGYRTADGGDVSVLGLDPRRDAGRLKQQVGIMLQQGGIYPGITAGEMLALFARFHAQPADPDALLEEVGLGAARATRFRRLSGGQQRRLALAVALIGQPELVFLDEPTAGMDPQARNLTWRLIRALKKRGATVVLTTHLMEEAERLADRIAIIDHGRLLVEGTAQQLRQQQHGARTSLRLTLPVAVEAASLAALPGVADVRAEGNGVYRLEAADPGAVAATLTAWLHDQQVLLEELRIGGASLEEVFLQLTGTGLRE
jgi:ABC-2 type transport system ATP-binding protein